jgi:hypothetical protein
MPVSFPITIDGSTTTVEPSEYDITTRSGKGARITITEYDDTLITIANALNYLYENGGGGGGVTDGDKGDITVSGSGTIWTIDAGSVTYAKIQDVSATSRILGRASAGAGDIEELTSSQVLTIIGVTAGAEPNAVDSVNSMTGAVVLDPDDLDDTSTTHKFISATELSKLAGIEEAADVTNATNVAAAGAAMAGGAFHDGFSDFVANEHIDWTTDQGATNIHSGNIPDLSSTYATAAKGVTNGDSHNHSDGDGASIPDTALLSGTTVTSSGATDSGKLVKLDANGHVDASCINDADINLDNVTEGTTNKFFTATDETTLAGTLQKSTATTKGDLLVASASATISRLAVGTDGHVLTLDSNESLGVKWAAAPGSSGGIAATIFDAKGDLIVASADDTAARLAVGTDGYVLTADSAQATGVKWASVSGSLSDGDKGDITVSGSGATWTIDNNVVTLAKLVDATAANVILGRITTGSGDFEELTATNVRTIINVEDGADVTDATNVAAAGAAMAGGAFHDGFSDFVANEHIDWTTDQGATNIHLGNIPDLSGTYATAAKGVTNGDSHDHSGGDGAAIPDAALSSGATVTSSGATDSGKLIKLDANGHVDASCINDADINLDNITEGSTNKFFTSTDETTLAEALQKSTATTKGDLLVATASATISRLGVGTNNYVLTADSAETSGIKWAALPSSMSDLVDDTTPELGGNLDINEKSIVCEFGTLASDHTASGEIITGTAGEALLFGDVCYLKSDGKFWKTDADTQATTAGMIVMALESISADATGNFLKKGYARDDTWAWATVGKELFISATAGTITDMAPSTTGQFVRLIGYAKAADYIEFDPSKIYLEVA